MRCGNLVCVFLHGDDSRRRRQQQQSEDDTRQKTANVYDNDCNNSTVVIPTNSRGLEKNEALAVRYLTRLCGVEQEVVIGQSYGEPITNVLPSDERTIYDGDIRQGGPTRIGIMLPHRYWCISACNQMPNENIPNDQIRQVGLQTCTHLRIICQFKWSLARRVVPRVRVYRELGCYLY